VGGRVFVFGGEDASRRPLGELHVLDPAACSWQPASSTGTPPSPRRHAIIFTVFSPVPGNRLSASFPLRFKFLFVYMSGACMPLHRLLLFYVPGIRIFTSPRMCEFVV